MHMNAFQCDGRQRVQLYLNINEETEEGMNNSTRVLKYGF